MIGKTMRPVLLTGLLALFAIGATLWWCARDLTAPARRSLEAHHRAWLADPGAKGVRLSSLRSALGGIPYLLVEADANRQPTERGRLLREQLERRGLAPSPFGRTIGALVLLHGRRGRKEDLLPVAERFAAVGLRCLLPDLPAHGENPALIARFGSGAGEERLARTVLEDAQERLGLPELPAVLWGMSMGGAYAVRAAADAPHRWSALILVSTFDDLGLVLKDQLASWGLEDFTGLEQALIHLVRMQASFDLTSGRPREWAAKLDLPVLVAHGDADGLIAPERGKRLFSAFPGDRAKWLPVSGGDHSRVLVTPQPVYAEMAIWMLDAMGYGLGAGKEGTRGAQKSGASHRPSRVPELELHWVEAR